MGILTVTLLGVLWTFWKGGALKELGLLALAVGVLAQLIGLYHAFSVMAGFEASQGLIAGDLKVSLTPTLYGLMIYILSVVLRVVRTWRQA